MSLKSNRVTFSQLNTTVEFMEKHPKLAQGTLKNLEGRNISKRLYHKLSLIVNAMNGAKKSPKGWAKYWADKKFAIKKAIVDTQGTEKLSEMDKRVYDLCFAGKDDISCSKKLSQVKKETDNEYSLFDDDDDNDDKSMDDEEDNEPTINFEEQPMVDVEERHADLMEKLVKVMGDQSTALSQLAQASLIQARAMDRLADASQIQARALDRLAGAFENIGSSFHVVKNAVVGIDTTMKRFYNTPTT